MIHEARQSAKFIKLVRKLRELFQSDLIDVETVATGLLERLWHFTLISAKRGDIGRHDNDLIAEAAGWYGDPDGFVTMLIDTGWLDESEEFRLLVHDWHDHCPGHLKRNIGKLGGFLTHKPELIDAKPVLDASVDAGSDSLPHPSMQEAATPNQTKPNQTKLSIRSICRSVEFKEKIEEIATVVAGRLKPRTDENRRLVWSIAVVACSRDGPDFADRLLDVLRDKRPKNPFAYATAWLRNQLAMEKPEFAELLDVIELGRCELRDLEPKPC